MRFIHTADWHIGRQFHNVSLLEDQAHILEQLIDVVRTSEAQALIIAGDVYDRAVPPADAVRLLGEVLERMVLGMKVPVIMIAGNHDSPNRLGFASGLLSGQGLHLAGPLTAPVQPITLHDRHGPVVFYPIPYAEPAIVRERFDVDTAHSHDAAMNAIIASIGAHRKGIARSVAVAHCFVTGGEICKSERPLTVGGAENVDASHFEPFSYSALGHLHRPQQVAATVQYSGSLLKYSFSEVAHTKSVTIVDIDHAGNCQTNQVALTPRRELRILDGYLEDILKGPTNGENRDDYLLVRLDDKHAILDAMGKLREVFPNVLHLERPGLFHDGEIRQPGKEQLGRSEQDLFTQSLHKFCL